MLTGMSLAAWLPDERLARRALWRLANGDPPRSLLSRLLLGRDGPTIRRRRNESCLGCRSRRSRDNRKTCAEGGGGRAGPGRHNDRHGYREIGLVLAVLRLM